MGPFSLSATLLFPPACIASADNEAISPLIITSLVAHCRLAPWCLRLPSNRGTTLTTTMWVIHRVHGRATHGRATSHMTGFTCLTDRAVLMIDIADLADGCHTENMYVALLTRGQAQQSIIALFRHQLGANARAAYHLAATPTLQLNVVNGRASRDVFQWQGIADSDVGLWPRNHPVPNLQAHRGQDVALFAIYIVQKRDTSRAIRIILDGRYFGWHSQFVALKVDQTIGAFRSTSTMAGGNLTLVVTSGFPVQLDGQRLLWPRLGDLLKG